ncbi:MAG: DUF3160 domain-containing protein [Actinomycetota bacterium]
MKPIALTVAAAMALLAAGCTPSEPEKERTTSPAATSSPTATEPPSAFAGLPTTAQSAFATFAGVPLLDPDEPAHGGPATPSSLDDVTVTTALLSEVEEPGVTAALTEQGFVVVPGEYRQLHFAYDDNLYSDVPSYVTTDAAYHVWHLVFDKVLRDVEQETLLPALDELVGGLLEGATDQAIELAGTPLEEEADRAVQLFQVATAALGHDVELGPLAAEEKDLIDVRGTSIATSPITGCPVAYSMFTPRGHYTRTEDLTRFFLGMSALSQLGFCLPGTIGAPGGAETFDPMRLAVLATRPLVADPDLLALWESIHEPTAFLVGTADDYRPHELADAAAAVSPTWLDDPVTLADDEALAAVVEQLETTREVRINADRASVLLMGTRFVLDGWILDQLLPPNVGPDSAGNPRPLPSAVDVAAVIGSTLAAEVQAETSGDFAGYDEQLAALTSAVADRPVGEWGNTVYDAWLYALAASFAERGAAFPDHQRTEAWATKGLQSGLGSYAELKHDTILYAKQAFAEMGGDFEEPETLRHWVEPDPVVHERLSAMASLMRAGFAERGLLGEQADLLDDTVELFDFLARAARTELAGDELPAADNDRLRFIGAELEGFAMRTGDPDDMGGVDRDQDAAIVADIATGVAEDGSTVVLEVATGRFDRILVLVPGSDGFQVAVGAVYAFHEFVSETGERLDDEAWRAILDAGAAPDRPAWQEVLFAR